MKNNQKSSIIPGFGLKDKESTTWEKNINKYIVIYPSNGNRVFMGKLIDIEENAYGILNPFHGADYSTGKPIMKLVDDFSTIFLPGAHIEPTSKKSLEVFCEIENERNNKENKKKRELKKSTSLKEFLKRFLR